MDKTILCVDDEEDILVMLECLFSEEGFNVLCFADGDKALDAVKDGNVGLVFTDLRMPKIDGMQLCRKIKNVAPEVSVYALSAFVSAYSPLDFDQAGFDGHLAKPFDINQLLDLCKETLGGTKK